MHELNIPTETTDRKTIYKTLLPQIKSVIEPETDFIANLANIAAILKEAFGFFWVGFYIYKKREGELVLGPFQGPLACTRIPLSKGVCGAAATQQKTQLVPDVEKFPGHIACSSQTRSEIVVPLVFNEETKLVLDIDSKELNDFDAVDQQYLEEIVTLLQQKHYK